MATFQTGESYSIQDVTSGFTSTHFTGDSHVTLYVYFRSQSGDLVDPQGGLTTEIKKGSTLQSVVTMVPLRKVSQNEATPQVGYYVYKFLTSGLTAGDYTVKFTGTYRFPLGTDGNRPPDEVIVVNGQFSLVDIPVAQELVTRLRTFLNDNQMRRYLLDNPEKYFWEDGELVSFLKMAIEFHNQAIPATPGLWTVMTPPPSMESVLVGGACYAVASRGLLEIANTLQYNDEINLTIDRGPKYQTAASWMATIWRDGVKAWKQQYGFSFLQEPLGLKTLRLPFTIIRPLSLRDEMQNTFGGFL